ncbi:MAG: hypothetical protein ACLRHG_00950 [Coprococcus phoceensis]
MQYAVVEYYNVKFYIDLKLIGLLKFLVVDANSEKTCQPRDFPSVKIPQNVTISNAI